jgi:hypothetical protein
MPNIYELLRNRAHGARNQHEMDRWRNQQVVENLRTNTARINQIPLVDGDATLSYIVSHVGESYFAANNKLFAIYIKNAQGEFIDELRVYDLLEQKLLWSKNIERAGFRHWYCDLLVTEDDHVVILDRHDTLIEESVENATKIYIFLHGKMLARIDMERGYVLPGTMKIINGRIFALSESHNRAFFHEWDMTGRPVRKIQLESYGKAYSVFLKDFITSSNPEYYLSQCIRTGEIFLFSLNTDSMRCLPIPLADNRFDWNIQSISGGSIYQNQLICVVSISKSDAKEQYLLKLNLDSGKISQHDITLASYSIPEVGYFSIHEKSAIIVFDYVVEDPSRLCCYDLEKNHLEVKNNLPRRFGRDLQSSVIENHLILYHKYNSGRNHLNSDKGRPLWLFKIGRNKILTISELEKPQINIDDEADTPISIRFLTFINHKMHFVYSQGAEVFLRSQDYLQRPQVDTSPELPQEEEKFTVSDVPGQSNHKRRLSVVTEAAEEKKPDEEVSSALSRRQRRF